MKKIVLLLFIGALGLLSTVKAQKFYTTSGGEMIFSFATIDNNGSSGNNIMRWSPVFNFQFFGNYDFSKHAGLIFGAAVRNVGYIDNNPDINNSAYKKKYRTYNVGIPIGFKIGNLDRFFLYGGYEIEFPFNYKEKTFIDGSKQDNKITVWFSKRTPTYYNTAFVGIQFPYGLNLKVKYYFTNFFNQDFVQVVDGIDTKPYAGMKANIIYFSLSFDLFKNYSIDYHDMKSPGRNTNNNIY